MFKLPVYKILNKFHNNKRRIRYNEVLYLTKIKKMLNLTDNVVKFKKEIV